MDLVKYGVIKYSAGKVFQSQYDNTMQQNIVVEFPEGDTERVYFPAQDPTYIQFRKGQQVKVVWSKTASGNMRKTVFPVEQQGAASAGQQAFSQPSNHMASHNNNPNYSQQKNYNSPSNSLSNLQFVKQSIVEFGIIFNLVHQKFPKFSEENKRAIANSILIEGRKKGRDFSTLASELQAASLSNQRPINQQPVRPTNTPQEIVPIEPPSNPDVAGYPNLPVPVKPVVAPPQSNANLEMLDNIPF